MNQTATAPTENKAPPISRSEKIFDWLVYGGIAGVGTFIATIPTTYWAKYGGGAKYFDASSKWLVKKGLSEQSAEQAVMTSALMQGGNLALIPVKWAEDNKVALVKKFGDVIGEKVDTVALEAEDKQANGRTAFQNAATGSCLFACSGCW